MGDTKLWLKLNILFQAEVFKRRSGKAEQRDRGRGYGHADNVLVCPCVDLYAQLSQVDHLVFVSLAGF